MHNLQGSSDGDSSVMVRNPTPGLVLQSERGIISLWDLGRILIAETSKDISSWFSNFHSKVQNPVLHVEMVLSYNAY